MIIVGTRLLLGVEARSVSASLASRTRPKHFEIFALIFGRIISGNIHSTEAENHQPQTQNYARRCQKYLFDASKEHLVDII